MALRKTLAFASTFLTALMFVVAPASAQGAKRVNSFGDWSLYTHDSGQTKTCFVSSQPKSSAPSGARRDSVFFYVTAWPQDGVKGEVSVKLGYPIKPDSDVTVQIGSSSFRLFAQEERAFVEDPTDELKLIDAIKRGSSMVVTAVSQRDTQTQDTYSLSGTTNALNALDTTCR